jgi:hypothetical protein
MTFASIVHSLSHWLCNDLWHWVGFGNRPDTTGACTLLSSVAVKPRRAGLAVFLKSGGGGFTAHFGWEGTHRASPSQRCEVLGPFSPASEPQTAFTRIEACAGHGSRDVRIANGPVRPTIDPMQNA